LLAAKGKVLLNLDKADRYFDRVFPLLEATGTTQQIIMKGGKPLADVRQQYGKYLADVIYMPIVNLDKAGAAGQIAHFVDSLAPVAYELLFTSDTNPLPRQLNEQLNGKALIWYNTLWEGMCGDNRHDDSALDNPQAVYGHLIDTLGARIIQTDRAELLLNYLKKRGLHE